jgi:hypothetical protein
MISTYDWGYRCRRYVCDKWIKDIEGSDALDSYPESGRERYERADALLAEIIGAKPCLFYVRRQPQSLKEPEYEIWEMTIATDHNGFQLPSKLLERQKTLQLWANVRKDGNECIWLRGINLVDLEQGEGDAFSSPSFINLVPNAQQRIGIPQEAFTQIMTMPICGSYVPTKEQIKRWGEYLEIEKRTAEKKQFCVPFVNHNHSNVVEFITFTIG